MQSFICNDIEIMLNNEKSCYHSHQTGRCQWYNCINTFDGFSISPLIT